MSTDAAVETPVVEETPVAEAVAAPVVDATVVETPVVVEATVPTPEPTQAETDAVVAAETAPVATGEDAAVLPPVITGTVDDKDHLFGWTAQDGVEKDANLGEDTILDRFPSEHDLVVTVAELPNKQALADAGIDFDTYAKGLFIVADDEERDAVEALRV